MARRPPIDRLLDQRVAALAAALPLARAGEVTGVHQARVASRRLREVVPMLAVIGREGDVARQAVRVVTQALGPTRELDVSLGVYERLRAEIALAPAADAALRRALATRRAASLAAARRTLTPARLARLYASLAAAAAAPRGGPGDVSLALTTRIMQRASRVSIGLARLGALYSAERLHAVRIAVKQLRYALEVQGALRRGATAATVAHLRAVQDLLGQAHDLHVLAEIVRGVDARIVARARAAAGDLRRLARHIDHTCRQLHAAFLGRRRQLQSLVERLALAPRPARSRRAPSAA